ncbi:ABC transporter ATP-binding protein [Staphylococcus kloosii]|jgi:ABC-2 type transport system ATP-binding protein|uniref:ABC transporter ATP-binding protein n=1 Tax=Staphylococcus kloosii TaxID=29384 RepID=UPI0028A39C80|nr:ABC transporter ATP-binding protein [Staphylococcus kloosii]MDT3958528.1 ABC transporter ATP-binding protein [Staphylococcus kloosii]
MNELKIRNLNKSYKNYQALKNINLDFQEHKIYGLLGNNGAGKSTLLNIINNRIYSTSGEVTLNNTSVVNNEKIQNEIFLMSEVDLYDKNMTVKKIFNWTKAFFGDFNFTLAHELSNEFKLNVNKKIGSLSTGYRSICKLIIALCVPCKFIFLDEPVLGLDAVHRKLFYETLIQNYADNPRTFIISTHLIEEISNILESIIILNNGEILLEKSLEDLYSEYSFIRGEKSEVEDFADKNNLKILGGDYLGNYASILIHNNRDDTKIPNNFDTESFDLQKLFVYLTREEGVKI